MLSSLLALTLFTPTTFHHQISLAEFGLKLQDQIHVGLEKPLEKFFDRPDRDLAYLMAMGQRSGGLKSVKVVILPSAPRWQGWGQIWAVLHTFQDCEQDHDLVMEVLPSHGGYKLGREVPIWENGGAKVNNVAYQATLHPSDGTVQVQTVLDYTPSPLGWSPVFRLNDIYSISEINHGAKIVSADTGLITPTSDTSFVRAGGVLIPWKPVPASHVETFDHNYVSGDYKTSGQLEFKYSANLTNPRPVRTDDQDVLNSREACIASVWIPNLGQLPTPVVGTIIAPKGWIVRGEGNPLPNRGSQTDLTVESFDCPLPISFPKVIGGVYQVAAQTTIAGQNFKVFQLPPLHKPEAQAALDRMTEAASFYQKVLGPLPFPGYELYISDAYYGIESYSHNILAARDAMEVSHELGHTYFGGIAPDTYVFDTWNEGVTQYIDSIALHHDEDKTLEEGLKTVGIKVPLTALPVPWSYNNASYTRGAYVMHMLESEITPQGVLNGLKALISDRVGKETRWDDLRQYFEKVSGKDLTWFWAQWIDASTFPTLTIADQSVVQRDKQYRTLVTINQSGTSFPYRMRLKLVATVAGSKISKAIEVKDPQSIVWIDTDLKPTEVKLEVFPDTLASVHNE